MNIKIEGKEDNNYESHIMTIHINLFKNGKSNYLSAKCIIDYFYKKISSSAPKFKT